MISETVADWSFLKTENRCELRGIYCGEKRKRRNDSEECCFHTEVYAAGVCRYAKNFALSRCFLSPSAQYSAMLPIVWRRLLVENIGALA